MHGTPLRLHCVVTFPQSCQVQPMLKRETILDGLGIPGLLSGILVPRQRHCSLSRARVALPATTKEDLSMSW